MKGELTRKKVCIISFSPICRDARVLRQIKYLSSHYDLTIIGYGDPHQSCSDKINIEWISLSSKDERNKFETHLSWFKILKSFLLNHIEGTLLLWFLRSILKYVRFSALSFVLLAGRFHSFFFEKWFWRQETRIKAFEYAFNSHCDIFHANDWDTLPVAGEAAKQTNAKLLFDAHEYAPLELENRPLWKLTMRPAITYFIKKYSAQIDASVTVASRISERYSKEFGLKPIDILNTPERIEIPLQPFDSNQIRLVHHGGAIPDRRLELMIETLALCDSRFSLHFMLIPTNSSYLNKLKRLAEDLVPGRISFHEPVPPEEIVRRISEYDIGFCLIAPTNYNYLVSLPNKFFDYIMAGLAVCIGPSPSMVEIAERYGLGCIAPSFDPQDVAQTLNQVTKDQISNMWAASHKAAREINAEREMEKLVKVYDHLSKSMESASAMAHHVTKGKRME